MSPVLLNFHSLVTVSAPQLTGEFQSLLSNRFPLFYRQSAWESTIDPDIIVEPFGEPPLVTETSRHIYRILGFSIFDYRGEVAVGLMHRGRPDVLVLFSKPLKILYRPRKGNQGRLYGMLLLGLNLCLRGKGALLVHGALVEKYGRTILLSGHRGSGKTQLLLNFMHRGWNFISDDKFILYQGNAFLFESHINIAGHLFQSLPWLGDLVKRSPYQWGGAVLRQGLRSFSHRYLPRRIIVGTGRVLDPAVQCKVKTLFPSCSIHGKAKPDHGYLLFQGRDFFTGKISRRTAIAGLSDIACLLFADTDSLERMLTLYAGADYESLQNLFDRNLPDMPFTKVVLPERLDMESVYQEIIKCCDLP